MLNVQWGSLQVESSRKTGVLVYNSSWVTLAVTSQREISRCDVTFGALCHVATWNSHVATSKIEALCHVATWNYHVATWNYHVATSNLHLSVTSRRGILTSRRGLLTSRRHFYTSRRHLVTYSATSRRVISRRDVI